MIKKINIFSTNNLLLVIMNVQHKNLCHWIAVVGFSIVVYVAVSYFNTGRSWSGSGGICR